MMNSPWDNTLLRTRTLGVAPFNAAGAVRIEEMLTAFAGVRTVTAAPDRWRVTLTYDLACTGLTELEEALRAAGFPPAGGWRARIQRAWWRWSEESVRSSTYAGGSCCGVPPEARRGRKPR